MITEELILLKLQGDNGKSYWTLMDTHGYLCELPEKLVNEVLESDLDWTKVESMRVEAQKQNISKLLFQQFNTKKEPETTKNKSSNEKKICLVFSRCELSLDFVVVLLDSTATEVFLV